nr:MAG TPA: hypothetical protein [Caudoviricetes sp.]
MFFALCVSVRLLTLFPLFWWRSCLLVSVLANRYFNGALR